MTIEADGPRRGANLRVTMSRSEASVPSSLGSQLTGHSAGTVQRRGWAGIKNGKLLALAAGEFDVLLTADKGIAYQQNLAMQPVSNMQAGWAMLSLGSRDVAELVLATFDS